MMRIMNYHFRILNAMTAWRDTWPRRPPSTKNIAIITVEIASPEMFRR